MLKFTNVFKNYDKVNLDLLMKKLSFYKEKILRPIFELFLFFNIFFIFIIYKIKN